MRRIRPTTTVLALGFIALPGAIGWQILQAAQAQAKATPEARQAQIERGASLIRSSGCHDCHTPFRMGPRGPEPDMTRALTGHPSDLVMPAAPTLAAGLQVGTGSASNTAWAGPWGVSFTTNLTPDAETGLGRWTDDMFITALRSGRHEGRARAMLPPVPYPAYDRMTDQELRSVFAYLQSLPPVRNRVPQPINPRAANQ